MDELTLEECQRQLEEEMMVCSSIYGDEFRQTGERECEISIRVQSKIPSVTILRLNFTPHYPALLPPSFFLISAILSCSDRSKLMHELKQLVSEHPGEPMVHRLAEHCRVSLPSDPSAAVSLEQPSITSVSKVPVSEAGKVQCSKDAAVIHRDEFIVKIKSGDTLTDRKSVFQAHMATVHSVSEVESFVAALKTNRKIAMATHNILAYRVACRGKDGVIQDCDDDGEHQAGRRLLGLLSLLGSLNVAVVVTRWYGGKQLGPDRFRHINNVARSLLVSEGFTDSKASADKKNSHRRR